MGIPPKQWLIDQTKIVVRVLEEQGGGAFLLVIPSEVLEGA